MTLRVENLEKSYRQSNIDIPVLTGVNFSLEKGESLAIVGSSGIGKSTLLHCIGLLDHWDRGEIYFDEQKVQQHSRQRARERRESIGFVFQFHYLMAELSALENVMVPLMIQGVSRKDAAERAREGLSQVKLEHRLLHRPSKLSGGEQQRVAIARALIHSPKVILADEPTGNLDPATAESVFEILTDQCRQKQSILVMATHNLELARRLHRWARLDNGKLVFE